MSLDQVFYWVGVYASVLSSVVAMIGLTYIVGILAMLVTGFVVRRLQETYRHIQLLWVMSQLEDKGKAQFREDYLDEE